MAVITVLQQSWGRRKSCCRLLHTEIEVRLWHMYRPYLWRGVFFLLFDFEFKRIKRMVVSEKKRLARKNGSSLTRGVGGFILFKTGHPSTREITEKTDWKKCRRFRRPLCVRWPFVPWIPVRRAGTSNPGEIRAYEKCARKRRALKLERNTTTTIATSVLRAKLRFGVSKTTVADVKPIRNYVPPFPGNRRNRAPLCARVVGFTGTAGVVGFSGA